MIAQARDAARELGLFTKTGLAVAIGVSVPTAAAAVQVLERKGTVEALGRLHNGRVGKPPQVYRFKKPDGAPANAPKRTPVEREAVAQFKEPRSTGQAKKKKRLRGLPAEVRAVVAEAEAEGWTYDPGGGAHPKLRREGESPIVLPTSPSDHRAMANLRSDFRKRR